MRRAGRIAASAADEQLLVHFRKWLRAFGPLRARTYIYGSFVE
jgi:hypothetical protein